MSENQSINTPIDPVETTTDVPVKRRRRRWPWIVGMLFLILVMLVVLAPTIASLGIVRSMVVPSVSKSVAPNGKLEIDSWSFGWFSGQKVNGIRVLDDQNAVVAHLNLSTGASLLSLARGNYNVGQTDVTGDFDIRIDPDTGRVNLLHILGNDQPAARTESPTPESDSPKPDANPSPIKIPDVKGKVLVDLNGTISSTRADSTAIPFTKVQSAKLNLDLSNLETGVAIDGVIQADVGGKPASIALKGTADAVENHFLLTDVDKIAADINARIDLLDLTLINTVLSALGMANQTVGGEMQGSLAIKLVPGGAATIQSGNNLGIDNLVYSSPALNGDTLSLKRTDLNINVSRQPQNGDITITSTGVKTDLATLDVTGSIPQAVLQNLSEQKAPGANGTIKINASVPDFAKVAAMLPNTIALKEGTTVTGGALASTTNIDIAADSIVVSQSAKLDASGTSDGKAIRLDPSTLNASAKLALSDGVKVDEKSVKEIAIDLVSPFATIKGSGVPEKIAFDGKIDATRAKQNISQFVDLGDKDFGGVVNFALNTQGLPTDLIAPLAVKLTFDTENLTYAQGGETLLQNEKFNGTIDLLYKQANNAKTITFKQLAIATESGLFGIWTAGDSQWISLFNNGSIAGEAKILSRIRPDKLAAMFAKNVDPSMKLTRGVLDSTLVLALDREKNEYRINLQSDLNKLDVGSMLKNERLQLGVTMFVPNTMAASHTWFDVASNFINVKGEADLRLADPKGGDVSPFDRVQKFTFDGQIPSIAKLHALATSFIGTSAAATATEPLAPLMITSGSAAFTGTVLRDEAKNQLAIQFDVPGVTDLGMSRGAESYWQTKPITMSIAANLDTAGGTDTVMEQIGKVVVSKLDAQVPGVVSVTMPTAIEVTGLSKKTPSANGAIRATGSLQPLGQLLGVVNGSNPLPVSGSFETQQTISSSGGTIGVVGSATLSGIQPIGKDAKPLPQQLQTIELANDLSADTKAMAATIRKFDLSVPGAKDVLSLTASGSIRDMGTKNTFDGVKAVIAYDLPQLWPIVQPFVDPTGASIGRVEGLKGKYQKTFTVAGSYPTADAAGKPVMSNDSIRQLQVSGDLQIDHANLVDQGIDVDGVSVPITLKDGVAKILFADGTGPKPFKLNGGEGSFGGLAIDLTSGEPVLVRAQEYQLLKNATLNPILSNALGKYFNPVFPNATKASALVDVKLNADKLRLGESLFTKNSGKAVITLSLRNMEISNPLGEKMLGGMLNKAGGALNIGGIDTSDFSNFRGELRNATFTLDRGVVTQDATFMIGNIDGIDEKGDPKLYPFKFTGNVSLANLEMNLAAGVPTALLRNKAKGDVAKIMEYLPDSLPIGFRGPTTNAKLDFNKMGNVFAEALGKFTASKLLGGDGKNDGKKSDLDKVGDVLGDLLGGSKKAEEPTDVPKKKKKD